MNWDWKWRGPIIHLQSVDNTIIFVLTDKKYLENNKKMLQCFTLMTRLRISYKNLHSLLLLIILWLQLSAGLQNYQSPTFGIPLGDNPRK